MSNLEPSENEVISSLGRMSIQPGGSAGDSGDGSGSDSRKELGIRDLPDELLLRIFKAVRDDSPPLIRSGPFSAPPQIRPNPRGIQNCRLTCRRFGSVASDLLFTHVSVHYRSSSLLRLEEISKCPVFRKNIRVVNVKLGLYREVDLSFLSFVVTQRARVARCTENHAEGRDIIMNSWMRIAGRGATPLTPNDPDYKQQALLLKMWNSYQQIFKGQADFLSGGDSTTFSKRVARAMSRMPSLKEIWFEHGNRRDDPGLKITVNHDLVSLDEEWLFSGLAAYYSHSAHPSKGDPNGDDIKVQPLYDIVQIPIAAHREGVRFDTIDIRF
ncbi:hypothetical protein QBC39DRAFT_143813 [Podospora conica]|nr:hypothetical protein QBC39DRAFT_143813 [Schizothecium conicum]